ncbi:cysteine desulfurase [Capsaspora owczarzaki ATCC 30864]|uniref:Cysteine desulfurase n=1 Tax=Capsaspora owczarzaki (strain ATCC 30864) TaxID=595528 RepID=A0A0D2VZT2_CAPO3|nr:cysteine desulfurase [Capsaspora owczarzaki ATCC 30864]KJE97387.1 cysteine desulfurase [Capsaspora owczarzaki ATCC 30864]|eukprot:XP_004343116.2 cysteine desulfurase [Capsaspora owczarzaki ATCC 30864]
MTTPSMFDPPEYQKLMRSIRAHFPGLRASMQASDEVTNAHVDHEDEAIAEALKVNILGDVGAQEIADALKRGVTGSPQTGSPAASANANADAVPESFDSCHTEDDGERAWAILENAGGSQVPASVVRAMAAYMTRSYVQIGAGYHMSTKGAITVDMAHRFVARLLNAEQTGRIILGSSASQLIYMLADCLRDTLEPGDEVVFAEAAHESNVTPWLALSRHHGIVLRNWEMDTTTMETCPVENLTPLLNSRTRVVIFPQVSNLLGTVVDVAAITKHIRARAPAAHVIVDGVAYAPHRVVDVKAWDVDYYVLSTYKVYGPHMGALYGKESAMQELQGLNHYFIPSNVPYKFEIGGSSHEGCAGLLGLIPYLKFLAKTAQCKKVEGPRGGWRDTTLDISRAEIVAAFQLMTHIERHLTRHLLKGLARLAERGLVVIGPAVDLASDAAVDARIPTVAFVSTVPNCWPSIIVRACHEKKVAIRSGHMYSWRMCEALDIDRSLGVCRVSLSHYNTTEEVDRFLAVLEKVLSEKHA